MEEAVMETVIMAIFIAILIIIIGLALLKTPLFWGILVIAVILMVIAKK